jgi:hypothetical protein
MVDWKKLSDLVCEDVDPKFVESSAQDVVFIADECSKVQFDDKDRHKQIVDELKAESATMFARKEMSSTDNIAIEKSKEQLLKLFEEEQDLVQLTAQN